MLEQEVETVVTDETPAEETSTEVEETSEEGAVEGDPTAAELGGEEAAEEVPAYTPNFKFKVMNKEHEIPERARLGVKDAETEKLAREIFEKAHGLDFVKPKYQEMRQEFQKASQALEQYESDVEELRTMYQSGDLDGFFEKMSINPENVLKWAVKKAQYSQLPEDQRRLHEEKLSTSRMNRSLEKRLDAIERQSQSQLAEIIQSGLEAVLERPDVAEFVQEFEGRNARPGSFRDLVTAHGDKAWQSGKRLQPHQVVQEVMTLLGHSPQAAKTAAPGQAAPAKKPPVIPHVVGDRKSVV
jgi:hypothetical protein